MKNQKKLGCPLSDEEMKKRKPRRSKAKMADEENMVPLF